MSYALRPETRENDVTVTFSAGIESRRARDSDAIVTVGRLRHVLVLQHSVLQSFTVLQRKLSIIST